MYNPKIRDRLIQDAQWQLQLQEDRMAFMTQHAQNGQAPVSGLNSEDVDTC
jgi:hypothetical protein